MKKEQVSESVAVSVAEPEKQTQALVVTGDGDIAGPIALALSTETADRLMQELQEALHQVQEGFGNLVAPGDIYKLQEPFFVVDAITINDYVDQRTGEEKIKHIFKLEFADGRVLMTMQSDARPRKILAKTFQAARALGYKVKAGPYLYEQKATGQVQSAFIFAQQPGFRTSMQ